MPQINEVDGRVIGAMTGAEKIRMLIRDAGFDTMTDFALSIGTHPQTVSYCINGDRTYPEVRDAIAKTLGIARAKVDLLIGNEEAA